MTELLKELEAVVGAIEEYEAHERPASDGCSDHEDAPHGFDRNGSHNADRYVCDCEGWAPDAAENDALSRKALNFLRTHHAEIAEALKDARRYRFVRGSTNNEGFWIAHGPVGFLSRWTGDNADIQIDAAIDAMHNSAREAGK